MFDYNELFKKKSKYYGQENSHYFKTVFLYVLWPHDNYFIITTYKIDVSESVLFWCGFIFCVN